MIVSQPADGDHAIHVRSEMVRHSSGPRGSVGLAGKRATWIQISLGRFLIGSWRTGLSATTEGCRVRARLGQRLWLFRSAPLGDGVIGAAVIGVED